MIRKLTDQQIIAVCRELFAADPSASGRALRAELKRRYGSSGKTDRVFAAWRMLRDEIAIKTPGDAALINDLKRQVVELVARLNDADLARESAEQRALLSEAREIAHQNRWANEIHDLRNEVRRLTGEGRRQGPLESRVLELTREVATLKAQLSQRPRPPDR